MLPTANRAESQQTFLGLPLVIIWSVLDQLNDSDIYAFRLVSRAFRKISEPRLLRELVLHDRRNASAGVFNHFCSRLCDPEDELREIVKDVRIGPLEGNVNWSNDALLERAIVNVIELRTLSWHLPTPIPAPILTFLHTTSPPTLLHLVSLSRDAPGKPSIPHPHNPLFPSLPYILPDYLALSSPNLHSLSLTTYGFTKRVSHLQWTFYSELPLIKPHLLQAHNLRKLSLRVAKPTDRTLRAWNVEDLWVESPRCFTFEEGERFPALRELKFEFESYDLSEEYCRQWARAADWSKLRRLDVDTGCPSGLFAALTGLVPQLKVLVFGFHSSSMLWGRADGEVFRAFANSVEGLEEVVAKNSTTNPFNEVKSALFEKHGHSLRILRVSYGATEDGWGPTDVEELARTSPGIQTLGLKIAPANMHDAGSNSSTWPTTTMKQLHNFPQLRSLSLSLRLDRYLQLFQHRTDLLKIFHAGGRLSGVQLIESVAQAYARDFYAQLESSGIDIQTVEVTFETAHVFRRWVVRCSRGVVTMVNG